MKIKKLEEGKYYIYKLQKFSKFYVTVKDGVIYDRFEHEYKWQKAKWDISSIPELKEIKKYKVFLDFL